MSPPPPPPAIPKEAWAGCNVILDINDGDKVKFDRLTRRATVNIGGRECSLEPLVGRPFGSVFRVEPCIGEPSQGEPLAGRLVSCDDAPSGDHYDDDGDDDADDGGDCDDDADAGDGDDDDETHNYHEQDENRDNRSLIDNNTAQALSSDDIETMKRDGVSGNVIVEALITNSSTFGKKTLQSQEKYKLKKQKKHAPKLLLRRPSTRSICETYWKKHADRTGAPRFMRFDALSLLLSMANVGAYSDVLVVDMVGGLVVGAVAERLGGTGYVCSTYLGLSLNSIDIIRKYNFSTDVTSRSGIEGTSVASRSLKAGEAPSSERMKYWKEHGFSSLIVAAPEHEIGSLVTDLLPILSYSAPFSVYHQHLEPLATCMHSLKVSKMAVELQISEPWLREYQVLPSRTHLHMRMNPFGGYLLSGIRIPDACSAK